MNPTPFRGGHALAALLTFGSLLAAAEVTYQVEPDGSTVTFHGSSTVHDFDGTAQVASGAIDLTPGRERGRVVVSATSMHTGNTSRDEQMHGEHLESAAHPTIAFTLGTLRRVAGAVTVEGTWEMHGVSRTVTIPVTLPDPAATSPRLRASFPIDMRDWNIPVPSAALVIRVDPVVQVQIDLALRIDPTATVTAAAIRTLGELSLSDQHGTAHRLDQEAKDRLVMLFQVDERSLAKRCDGLLSSRLGASRPLLRVIDGREYGPDDRPRLAQRLVDATRSDGVVFLLDWDGEVAKRLSLPAAPLLFLGFDAGGRLTGKVPGERTGAALGKALALIGLSATPPFADEQVNPRTKGAR